MPLESATYISDLNASNPVGSTDKVQTLDDHVRLIKSTVKASFPNVTGAMTASHAELNILDGATLSTAELNILDGVTLTAAQINDAARKSVSNTFTANLSGITGTLDLNSAVPGISFRESGVAANNGNWRVYADAEQFVMGTVNDADTNSAIFLQVDRTNHTVDSLALAATAITVNGVNVTDFARQSQSNIFLQSQSLQLSTNDPLSMAVLNANAGAAAVAQYYAFDGANFFTFALRGTGHSSGNGAHITTSGNLPLEISTGSGTLTLSGVTKAATIANSTSTTLVTGQLHFIDGDATLPNLTAGQWIQVINDGSSSRTISKNGSDTTYYTLTGASISTSFTLAARGVLTARCNPAGTAVYVSGSGITAAS